MRAQLQTLASSTSQHSLAASFRRKRFALFQEMVKSSCKPLVILDVGGRQEFWEVMGWNTTPHTIILLNLYEFKMRNPNFISVVGDACSLRDFSDQSIDIVFSNSVIEHLYSWQNQQRMADEVRRVGKHYYIQTPTYYSPVEPHFLCPLFHWLPRAAQTELICRMPLGYIEKQPCRQAAEKTLDEFRLLDKVELSTLFPDAVVHEEKLFGLTKSYIAVK